MRGDSTSRSGELQTKNTDAVPEIIGDDLPPALLEGASKAKEFTSTLARGPREFLVALRSEGQFVGEMASFTTAAVRCATVRAKGNVRVKVIPGELLHDCVERIPEVLHPPKESELALVYTDFENLLATSVPKLRVFTKDALTNTIKCCRLEGTSSLETDLYPR